MKNRPAGIILFGFVLTFAGAAAPSMAATVTAGGGPSEAAAGAAISNQTAMPASSLPEGEKRYIVKYESGANAEAESDSLKQKGIEVKDTISHTMKASVVVATPTEIASVQAAKNVTSVEPDTRVSISSATSIWGIDRVDQRTGRDGQYSIGDEGGGVNIYFVDTGLNMSHTEFTGRIIASWTGINDGNGVNDCNGHGTHVAGTAAGTTYGIAKKANIIPVRVVECDGSGWNSTAIAGIDWAVAHHSAGQPAVMNMSIGGFASDSFDEAVQSAVNDGITVVAAAGNDGVDACGASPARIPAAITVAATDTNDAQVSWSDYGSCVDIQAPGVSIKSAWNNSPTGYNTLSGTSMATPHVSGAAAVLLSRNPTMSPADVQQTIINNATLGAVSANKGATPNRFLFIPGMPPAPPNCSALKPGDAWAGVGLYCGLGSAASVPSAAGAAEPTVEAPAITAATDAAGTALSVAAPAPAQPAPVLSFPPSQQAAAPPLPSLPAAVGTVGKTGVAGPLATSHDEDVALGPDAASQAGAAAPAAARATETPFPLGAAASTTGSSAFQDGTDARTASGEDAFVWAVTSTLILGGLALAHAMVRRKPSGAASARTSVSL